MKKPLHNSVLILLVLCVLMNLCSCHNISRKEYYENVENYVAISGIIIYMNYNDDHTALYIAFSDMDPKVDDNNFKIVGGNVEIIKENRFDELVKIGDKATFVTAPHYYGDGYVMPLVSIEVNGVTYLEFETGFENFLTWLKNPINYLGL